MRRHRYVTILAVAAIALHAGAAGAATNLVTAGRLGVVQVGISVTDLAPPACAGMDLTTLVTADTGGRGGKIHGTQGNDLLLGTAGDDDLDAKGGDDCVVGGAGSDDLDGGPGNDRCDPGGDPGDSTKRCES